MTLVDITQEKIKQLILEKTYDDYGFLPSEGELCRMLEVSRATMREAVRAMEVRGFVKRIQGKGIQIVNESVKVLTQSMMDMVSVDEISNDDLLEVRRIVEVPAASIAAKRAKADDIARLQKYVRIMEDCSVINEEYQTADFNFHVHMVKATSNKLLISLSAAYNVCTKQIIKASLDSGSDLEKDMHYHRGVLEAIVSRDSKLAGELMEVHLKATEKNVKNKRASEETKCQ
ncbi:MAG: FadR family transcriptional regulator [Peptostreptococcaceae bacterium]|nr:FadR family transcriptional regulator [Peptostreptococcaceae bacterium]